MTLLYYVIHDDRTGDDSATLGTYTDLHRDTFNPNTRATCIIPLKISGKSYKERKNDLENKAIEFSNNTAPGLFWSEVDTLQTFFETNGRRYGLLKEFKENAIC